jgi:hypothetical protein
MEGGWRNAPTVVEEVTLCNDAARKKSGVHGRGSPEFLSKNSATDVLISKETK